jgi:hypothetical protein
VVPANSFIPPTYALEGYQGDDFSFSFRVRDTNSDGTPGAYKDLSAAPGPYVATAQLRVQNANPLMPTTGLEADFDCTLGDQTNDAEKGTVVIQMDHTVTATVPVGAHVYDVQLTDAAGRVQTYLRGPFTMDGEVTLP